MADRLHTILCSATRDQRAAILLTLARLIKEAGIEYDKRHTWQAELQRWRDKILGKRYDGRRRGRLRKGE